MSFSDESNIKYAAAREQASRTLGTSVKNYTEIKNSLGVSITAKELGGFDPSIVVDGWAFFDAEDARYVAEAITRSVIGKLERLYGGSV